MAWKLATGFVMTAETWLGPERTRSGEEAVPQRRPFMVPPTSQALGVPLRSAPFGVTRAARRDDGRGVGTGNVFRFDGLRRVEQGTGAGVKFFACEGKPPHEEASYQRRLYRRGS